MYFLHIYIIALDIDVQGFPLLAASDEAVKTSTIFTHHLCRFVVQGVHRIGISKQFHPGVGTERYRELRLPRFPKTVANVPFEINIWMIDLNQYTQIVILHWLNNFMQLKSKFLHLEAVHEFAVWGVHWIVSWGFIRKFHVDEKLRVFPSPFVGFHHEN